MDWITALNWAAAIFSGITALLLRSKDDESGWTLVLAGLCALNVFLALT